MALWRLDLGGEPRLAVGESDQGPQQLLARGVTLAHLLGPEKETFSDLSSLLDGSPTPRGIRVLAPIDTQPVWAAGVTFERSRQARKQEAASGSCYDLVYDAERPELFLKALPGHARGPGEAIGIRADSTWDVPEPELAMVVDHTGRIVGQVLGNDVSSRSIEGENPLYLPQAKVYDGSCSIGPCIVPVDGASELDSIEIMLTIQRDEAVVYADSVLLSQMRRHPQTLVDWLFRAQRFPAGVVLLTGTSIVPDTNFTLQHGHQVTISADGLGSLRNTVQIVGETHEGSR